ncbi:hypothetical protein HHL17_22465 [Chitinophaga sp. G-6-1-13]|uniref:Terpene synthase n=1 Tax=Chitinophaga fulva TaxID=2728842 RepID=A0A848GS95_9BACT|nr:terpene synthase family protein [Chitinophaga fulva]NML39982.1 hypothetical protein [Chitinophaga fulva]
MKRELNIPVLQYPWPTIPAPYPDYFAKEEAGWLDADYTFMAEEAVRKYKGHCLADGASYMAPTTINIDHLRPMARFFLWLTLYDDYYELWPVKRLAEERDRIIDIMLGESPKAGDIGLYRQAAIFRDEFLSFMPYEWMERLAKSMYRYTTYGIMEEHRYRTEKRFPSILNLTYLREYAIGMYPYGDLVEPGINFALPRYIAEHPVIMRLRTLLCRVMFIQNDWYTLEKEMAEESEVCNMILALRHHHKISLEEAMEEARRMHDEYVKEMVGLQDNLPDFGDHQKAVENYVFHLGLNITGLNDWYNAMTVRYIPSEFAWHKLKQ